MSNRKREPWRIMAAVLSVIFITWIWVKKDLAAVYASMPPEQMLPLLATTAAVTLLKVGAGAGIILIIRKIALKLKKSKAS